MIITVALKSISYKGFQVYTYVPMASATKGNIKIKKLSGLEKYSTANAPLLNTGTNKPNNENTNNNNF